MTTPASDEHDPLAQVFQALGDPTRRAVLRLLVESPDATATQLSASLPLTRQAVSKHLTTLREAGLVQATRSGRNVRYRLEPSTLHHASSWIEDTAHRWDRRLERLRQRVDDGSDD